MSDLISRQAAIEAALSFIVEYCGAAFDEDMQMELKQRLEGLPSIQPEIIMCKDCTYSHMTYSGECKYCDIWDEVYDSGEKLYLEGDFFCAFGKRIEEMQNKMEKAMESCFCEERETNGIQNG